MFTQWPPLGRGERISDEKSTRMKDAKIDRRGRLLNAKQRAIGIDMEGIEGQLEWNRNKQEQETKDEEAYAEFQQQLYLQRTALEEKASQDRRNARGQTEEVWKFQSRTKNMRPEWDLNDPKQLSKDPLPNDEITGPSAAQFFKGENAGLKESLAKARREQFEFITAKVNENQMMREKESEWERMHADALKAQLEQRSIVEAEEARKRAEHALKIRQENEWMARQKREREQRAKEMDEHDASREHQHIGSSAYFQYESRDKMRNNETGRIVRQEWKGMPPSELDEIRRIQREQQEANRKARSDYDTEQKEMDDNYEALRVCTVGKHNREARDRRAAKVDNANHLALQKEIFRKKVQEQKEYDRQGAIWWPWGQSDR